MNNLFIAENLKIITKVLPILKIQIHQTDQALRYRNAVDLLKVNPDVVNISGYSSGGATALAQAALQSKKGVSATIEKQEAENERMRAEGEVGLQNMRETRENAKLDRYSALSDQATIQARASANGQTMAKQAMFDLGADSLMATASGLSGVGGTTGTEAIDNLVDPNAKTD